MENMSDRPSSGEILAKWVNRSTLTETEIQTAALDTLDFLASVVESGGKVLVQMPGRKPYPVDIQIPGLTTEN
jgi:hypothetical protein